MRRTKRREKKDLKQPLALLLAVILIAGSSGGAGPPPILAALSGAGGTSVLFGETESDETEESTWEESTWEESTWEESTEVESSLVEESSEVCESSWVEESSEVYESSWIEKSSEVYESSAEESGSAQEETSKTEESSLGEESSEEESSLEEETSGEETSEEESSLGEETSAEERSLEEDTSEEESSPEEETTETEESRFDEETSEEETSKDESSIEEESSLSEDTSEVESISEEETSGEETSEEETSDIENSTPDEPPEEHTTETPTGQSKTPKTEAPTEQSKTPKTEVPTERSEVPGTEPPSEPPTEPSREPSREPPTEPSTEPSTEPPTEPSSPLMGKNTRLSFRRFSEEESWRVVYGDISGKQTWYDFRADGDVPLPEGAIEYSVEVLEGSHQAVKMSRDGILSVSGPGVFRVVAAFPGNENFRKSRTSCILHVKAEAEKEGQFISFSGAEKTYCLGTDNGWISVEKARVKDSDPVRYWLDPSLPGISCDKETGAVKVSDFRLLSQSLEASGGNNTLKLWAEKEDGPQYGKDRTSCLIRIAYAKIPEHSWRIEGKTGNNGWYLSPVTIRPARGWKISAECLPGTFADGMPLSASAETLSFYLRNAVTGEIGCVRKTEPVRIDAQPPTGLRAVFSRDAQNSNSSGTSDSSGEKPVTVTFSAVDEGSGVAAFRYILWNSQTELPPSKAVWSEIRPERYEPGKTAEASIRIPEGVLSQNSFSLSVCAVDAAGNISESVTEKHMVMRENISPELDVEMGLPVEAQAGNSYYSGDIQIFLHLKDRAFSPERLHISVTRGQAGYPVNLHWREESAGLWQGEILLQEEGSYSLQLRYLSETGEEVEYHSPKLILDRTMEDPLILLNGRAAQGKAMAGEANLSVILKEAHLKRYGVSVRQTDRFDRTKDITPGSEKWRIYTESDSTQISLGSIDRQQEKDGVYHVHVWAEDLAGHRREQEASFSINRFGSVYEYDSYIRWLLAGSRLVRKVEKDLIIREYNASPLESGSQDVSITRDGQFVDEPVYGLHSVENTDTGEDDWNLCEYIISRDNFRQDGIYTVSIFSQDKAGNASENIGSGKQSIRFRVDKTPPEIQNISGLEQEIVPGDTQVIHYVVYDAVGVESVGIYVDGILKEENRFLPDTTLADGDYTLTLSQEYQNLRFVARDMAGNITDTDRTGFQSGFSACRRIRGGNQTKKASGNPVLRVFPVLFDWLLALPERIQEGAKSVSPQEDISSPGNMDAGKLYDQDLAESESVFYSADPDQEELSDHSAEPSKMNHWIWLLFTLPVVSAGYAFHRRKSSHT